MHVVLRHTRWGLHTIGRGRQPDRRERGGHSCHAPQDRQFRSDWRCSAGFTGILEAFRIGSIDPQAGGNQIMFLAVAAGVIGGTPLAGGSGTIIGGLIGAVRARGAERRVHADRDQRVHLQHHPGRGDSGGYALQHPLVRLRASGGARMSDGTDALRAEDYRQAFRRGDRAGWRVGDAAARARSSAFSATTAPANRR